MGLRVIAAHTPIVGSVVLITLRIYGVAPFDFDTNAVLSASIGLILPLLLLALYQRSKEILAVQVRARTMASTDPLTGSLATHLFTNRVRAACGRFARSRHNAVIMYVRLVNYAFIRDTLGGPVAEECLIRSAVTMRRLMHDADSIGRVGDATLGLIYESVTDRAVLMERASRLIAYGLRPQMDLAPDVTITFHIAACILSENPMDAPAVHTALANTLESMTGWTRRPIRFVEPEAAQP
jgi:GGDEF domain-containing protein